MKITVIDTNLDFVNAFSALSPENINIIHGSIQSINPEHGTAYVSPANSFLFMDGGIDWVYSRIMFPGLEKHVQKEARNACCRTSLGRPFLPIGKAMLLSIPESPACIIMAPTMFFPQDVHCTHNAYHATYAAVRCALKSGCVSHLVFSGMCTGIGKMVLDKAAEQMNIAIKDATEGRHARYSEENIRNEQPKNYSNKEYFDTYNIDISKKIIDIKIFFESK